MNKKLMAVCFSIFMIFGVSTMALADSADVGGYVGTDTYKLDEPGGNDWAGTGGGSWADFSSDSKAGSLFGGYDTVGADGNAMSRSRSNVNVSDTGLTSQTSTYVFTKSKMNTDTFGSTQGFLSGSKSYSKGSIGGSVLQEQEAMEWGYVTAGAAGYNTSTASYEGLASDFDLDLGLFSANTDTGVRLKGKALTGGFTKVTVDPSGNTQSASGITANLAKASIYGDGSKSTDVSGSGEIHTFVDISNNNAIAVGTANGMFKYTGSNFGAGVTMSDVTGTIGTNSASISAHSFSASIAR